MTAITIDFDEITPFGDIVDNRLFWLQLVTQLIEVGHLELGAAVNLAAVGL